MSRSRCSAALQIPISFQCRRSNEEDHHGTHGGHGSDAEAADIQLSLTGQASVNTANAERFHVTSSSVRAVFDRRRASDSLIIAGHFESLSTTETESSVSSTARENSHNVLAQESAFPPLPVAQSSRQQKFRNNSERMGGSTMASRVRRLNNVQVLNSTSAWPTARPQPKPSATNSRQMKPIPDSGLTSLSSSSVSSQNNTAAISMSMPSANASSGPVRQASACGLVSSNNVTTGKSPSSSKVSHATSVPKLVERIFTR